jgi:hypothetical protein
VSIASPSRWRAFLHTRTHTHTSIFLYLYRNFIIASADRKVLDEFRTTLLRRVEGTYERCARQRCAPHLHTPLYAYEGEVHTYLGCEILPELEAGKTLLSQKHYAEDVLRTYDYWDCIPALTPMTPGSRLMKGQCDPHPDPAFHRRHRGIVGSLGYLVNMTRPDLAWSYSELSKYVQNPGKARDTSSGTPQGPGAFSQGQPRAGQHEARCGRGAGAHFAPSAARHITPRPGRSVSAQ